MNYDEINQITYDRLMQIASIARVNGNKEKEAFFTEAAEAVLEIATQED